jgi:hypothetical protein
MSSAEAQDPHAQAGDQPSMDALVSLCARRGFIWQSSEIYGGINGFWDYGPLGVELKNRLKARWWQKVVREREDVEGLDSSIIAHPRTWEASGHVEHFSDPMVDCRTCKRRFRADQLEGPCPEAPRQRSLRECDLTEARDFNLMLKTSIGASHGLSAGRDVSIDFSRLQAGSRERPSEASLRHRPDWQGVSQRDQPTQLYVPIPRVRAGGARVLRPQRRAGALV